MGPAGLKAFEARSEKKSVIYSYEQKSPELDAASLQKFRKNKAAWTFLQAQPSWYRKLVAWRIASAKKEATRIKRLEKLIADSAQGRRS